MADTNNVVEKVIKTIILLRSDTNSNFASSNIVLRRGEVAISIPEDPTQPCSAKVGVDGVIPWNDLPYSFGPLAGEGGDGSGGTVTPGVELSADGKTLQIKNNIISIIGADDPENVGKSFRITASGNGIEWFTPADGTDVENNSTQIENLAKNLLDNYYNKADTDELVAKVFRFRGTKTSMVELEATTNPQVGDVWVVKEDGQDEGNLYVYAEDENGDKYWEDFPLTIDLSAYTLKVDFDTLKDRVDVVEGRVDSVEDRIDAVESDISTLKNDVDTLKSDTDTLKTDLAALEEKVDNLPSGGGNEDGDTEGLAELTERVDTVETAVDDINTYLDSVKPTINSLPDTIFSAMEVQTLQNGDIRILGEHFNKDTDGTYGIGGQSILATLKAVTANGNPGLMTGEDKAKLDKLFEVVDNGGQPNVIEVIRVGGEDLPINSIDKSVNIPVASSETLGVVKVASDDNTEIMNPVKVDDEGIMSVPEVNVETLVASDDFMIDGGTAGAWG